MKKIRAFDGNYLIFLQPLSQRRRNNVIIILCFTSIKLFSVNTEKKKNVLVKHPDTQEVNTLVLKGRNRGFGSRQQWPGSR